MKKDIATPTVWLLIYPNSSENAVSSRFCYSLVIKEAYLLTPHDLVGDLFLPHSLTKRTRRLNRRLYHHSHTRTRHLLIPPSPFTQTLHIMDDDDEAPPPRPLLLLISHARTTPLRKAPDLKYDARAVHNPPKQMRDKFTGVDKRLREHMLSHGDFVALLDRAEGEVKGVMRRMTEGDVGEGIPPLREWRRAPTRPNRRAAWEMGKEEDELGVDGGDDGEGRGEDGVDEDEEDEGEELDDEERPTLRVGVFCVRGRHRSVALVEELGQREWPKEWEVRVVHRDLGRSNRKGSIGGKRGFNRRDSLGRGFLDEEDD
jgi:hypothetical protein